MSINLNLSNTINMEASIDIDLCCHLGFIKSIDMLDRGFYYIEISLLYSNNIVPIAPVGCFSAASTLTSKVKNFEIKESILLNNCHISETSNTFETRSFLIRYKDEIHELNDGCHWRLTLSKINLQKLYQNSTNTYIQDNTLPHCSDDLSLKFRLLRSKSVSFESANDLEVICRDPEWEFVAQQTIDIQYASSGLHEYYPVSLIIIIFMYKYL